MAKSSGVGSRLFVGTADLSGDTGSIDNVTVSAEVIDVTGIDKSAPEKILGRRSGTIAFSGFWNTTAGAAHPVLSALPRTDVQMTYLHGTTVGEVGASLLAKQITYSPSFAQNGALTIKVNGESNGYPAEWGELLTTGQQTFASGTVTNASINAGSASAFGAAGYLHAFSIASGTATVAIQDSPDNITFTNVTGMVFTVTAAGTQRLQGATNATVNQYVQAKVTGTYTTLVASLLVVRYLAAP